MNIFESWLPVVLLLNTIQSYLCRCKWKSFYMTRHTLSTKQARSGGSPPACCNEKNPYHHKPSLVIKKNLIRTLFLLVPSITQDWKLQISTRILRKRNQDRSARIWKGHMPHTFSYLLNSQYYKMHLKRVQSVGYWYSYGTSLFFRILVST